MSFHPLEIFDKNKTKVNLNVIWSLGYIVWESLYNPVLERNLGDVEIQHVTG